jgi:hypothetical protein
MPSSAELLCLGVVGIFPENDLEGIENVLVIYADPRTGFDLLKASAPGDERVL